MKKILRSTILLTLFLSTVNTAYAANNNAETFTPNYNKNAVSSEYSEVVKEINIILNGTALSFSQPPYIEDGTTMVPMRAIFEALGAEVNWNNSTKTITATKNGTKIVLTIDNKTALINGKSASLAKAPLIKEGSTMVPLRFVSESLGAKVDWDNTTKNITIAGDNSTSSTSLDAKSAFMEKAKKIEEYDKANYEKASLTSQLEINKESGKVYTMWDELLNEIYTYLKQNLGSAEFKALEKEEIEWIKEKEAAIDVISKEWGDSGTGASMMRSRTGIEYTQARCYELINIIK